MLSIMISNANALSRIPVNTGRQGFFRSDNYDNGASWTYHTDCAEPFGDYLDNFWDTENDWYEGQQIEVLAYAEFPCWLKEEDLEE